MDEICELFVCGLHMQGFELHYQLKDLNAVFYKFVNTAPEYKMYLVKGKIDKPGLVKCDNGEIIAGEIYKIPVENIGKFLQQIPAPLGLGKVKMDDGSEVIGFICEGIVQDYCEDITRYKSWKNYALSHVN